MFQLNYIGTDLHNTRVQSWVVVVLSLVQGVLGPVISTASDTFQARKPLLVGSCAISFVGACIAPGSNSIYRLIGANVLVGVGFASVPLAYAVPSEILPRRWRPCKSIRGFHLMKISLKQDPFQVTQAGVNIAAILATISGPFMIGTLTKRNSHTGWRLFYVSVADSAIVRAVLTRPDSGLKQLCGPRQPSHSLSATNPPGDTPNWIICPSGAR
jgi:MFS family permease